MDPDGSDGDVLDLAVARGLAPAAVVARLRRDHGDHALAALIDSGQVDAATVRQLRGELTRRGIPRSIGRYLVGDVLGSGGSAVVVRAVDTATGCEVAVKVVAPRLAGDPTISARFLREAQAARRVSHPNLIACRDAGTCDGLAYLVFDCMPGGDLESLLAERGGALPEAQALHIARDCARAMRAIAAAGLVHRDVKPANLFLDAFGNARLADFGLVIGRDLGEPAGSGRRAGSPGYMAPEQATGAGEPDPRSDIYSLGATLYHLLTGRRPFAGATPIEIIARALREDAPAPRQVAPWVSPAAEAIVVRAMAREPDDRYPDAAALIADLDAAIAGAPLPGQSETTVRLPAVDRGLRGWLHRFRRLLQRGRHRVRRRPALGRNEAPARANP